MISRNDPCWCGSKKKWKQCHFPNEGSQNQHQKEDDLAIAYWKQYRIILKNEKQIEGIRKACELNSQILDLTCEFAKEGMTTQELNDFAHKLTLEAGAIPAPLGYGSPPFTRSICTSLNEVICHGIPDQTKLRAGDILNIDTSSILNGFYGDCSRMVMIGEVSAERRLVVDVSYECLMRSIAILKPGIFLCEIGNTIEAYAKEKGCSVVNQFVGHGVGIEFHENPQVAHHRNRSEIPLASGMIFTIEPMINAGVREAVIDADQWTARTRDGRASAQWEHTILITPTGHEILTPWKRALLPQAS